MIGRALPKTGRDGKCVSDVERSPRTPNRPLAEQSIGNVRKSEGREDSSMEFVCWELGEVEVV